jgi:hypothetical protein
MQNAAWKANIDKISRFASSPLKLEPIADIQGGGCCHAQFPKTKRFYGFTFSMLQVSILWQSFMLIVQGILELSASLNFKDGNCRYLRFSEKTSLILEFHAACCLVRHDQASH